MKVVILCGGKGTRLQNETEFRPKPMLPIGDRPILWHIIKTYSHYGFNEFVLCLGYKGEMIKEYFRNYLWNTCDTTLSLGQSPETKCHTRHSEEDWRVTLADTGQDFTHRRPGVSNPLAAEGQMRAYKHEALWQSMDTYREFLLLNNFWRSGNTPWKVW